MRQPQRAPIFSRNDGGVPRQLQQNNMSVAEVNEALARMAKPSAPEGNPATDERVLPVQGVEIRRRPAPEPEPEVPSILAQPIQLPHELLAEPGETGDVLDDAEVPRLAAAVPQFLSDAVDADDVFDDRVEAFPANPQFESPTTAIITNVKTADDAKVEVRSEPDAVPAVAATAKADGYAKVEAGSEFDPEPAVAATAPSLDEPIAPAAPVLDDLIRSAQAPPPPPVRPAPGVKPPTESPKVEEPEPNSEPDLDPEPLVEPKPNVEDALRVEDAPRPADSEPRTPYAPRVEEGPNEADPKPTPTPEREASPKVEDVANSDDSVEPLPKVDAPAPASLDEAPLIPSPPARAVPDPMDVESAVEPTLQQAPVQPDAPAPTSQTTTQTFTQPTTPLAATPVQSASRWSFWNWKSKSKSIQTVHGSPQHAPAHLPTPLFPTSYESVWAKPLAPCPDHARIPLPSAQSAPVAPSPQKHGVLETSGHNKITWLTDRFHNRVEKFRHWKHERLCKHIQAFKAQLKGDQCSACKSHGPTVTPSGQSFPTPSPQMPLRPTPQVHPTPQEPPLIGGSRFGLYGG